MSLLGIDVGTTGCKAAIFSEQGQMLALAYEEYDYTSPHTGWAELDSYAVWDTVKRTIHQVVSRCASPAKIRALSVSSLGEAVVPVTRDHRILGPSLLNFDIRGKEYLPELHEKIDDITLHQINGNPLGNHYTLTKLRWLRDRQPQLYAEADYFLHWSGLVLFMLGADPITDYSLANRTLLFDLAQADWSSSLLDTFQIDSEKLPRTCPSARKVGTLSLELAAELGLSPGIDLVSGAHDQCANALGCGAIEDRQAAFGLGTYICITPVYNEQQPADVMLARGLNTEHHVLPEKYVSFIYNPGGALVKWYRDTFAHTEHKLAQKSGKNIYDRLFTEIPASPSPILVLPHFAPTGPPEFITDSSGVMIGLRLDTSRGDVLKGILEGTSYYLKECVDSLPATGIYIDDYRVAGGGSKSDAWVQLCADIFERPFTRPRVTEAGTLGAALMAGVGSGVFNSFAEGVEAMVQLDRRFEPDPARSSRYQSRYEHYKKIWPLMRDYLQSFASEPSI